MADFESDRNTFSPGLVEPVSQFENRKRDHIAYSLEEASQTSHLRVFDKIELTHDSVPDLDMSNISLKSKSLGTILPTPFYVSAMTAGHKDAEGINYKIAEACEESGWVMMVGSQRGELVDPEKSSEWKKIRKNFPNVKLIGNLGLSQLKHLKSGQVENLVETLGAYAMAIHCNPLQEAIQPEGTTDFSGSLDALKNLVGNLGLPVILKETGSGFSIQAIEKIKSLGLSAIDVSGLGGTHWGRIEGMRAQENSIYQEASQVFANFGVSSPQSIENLKAASFPGEIWGSGGIRNGLDAAKLLAMGAVQVGMAQPILKAALKSSEAVLHCMKSFEYQLLVAMFCSSSADLQSLKGKYQWK